MSAALLALTPFLPLALALAFVPLRARASIATLMPLAPLPALVVAVIGEPGLQLLLPHLLLGLELGLDGYRRLLLGFTALLWLAAAVYGRGYIHRDQTQHRYNAFFLATMGGNLGLIVALDVAGFYLFFSLMTLSSYILVVFERTPEAYRAGRAYIVLSILGETSLLLGFLRAVSAADSLLIADIPPVLAVEAGRELTVFLLYVGFAIKAGLLPLHFWLPLAHPAAPTPASAVLSGAMIKAGLFGMILFLPIGEAGMPAFGPLLAVVGLTTALYGSACGLAQTNPKTVLAYSSLSQMGVMIGALGAVVAAPAAAPAVVPTVVLYAVHHGLTKGALFLGVGVIRRSPRHAFLAMAVATLCAFAIAGLPVTGGALAKLLLKEGLQSAEGGIAAPIAALLPLSALVTALLMLRFIVTLSREAGSELPVEGAGPLLWGPYIAVATLSQLIPWGIVLADGTAGADLVLSIYGLWESAWPFAVAVIVAGGAMVLARRSRRLRLPSIPEGDLIALLPEMRKTALAWDLAYRRGTRFFQGNTDHSEAVMARFSGVVEQAEKRIRDQPANAFVVVTAVLCFIIALLV